MNEDNSNLIFVCPKCGEKVNDLCPLSPDWMIISMIKDARKHIADCPAISKNSIRF